MDGRGIWFGIKAFMEADQRAEIAALESRKKNAPVTIPRVADVEQMRSGLTSTSAAWQAGMPGQERRP